MVRVGGEGKGNLLDLISPYCNILTQSSKLIRLKKLFFYSNLTNLMVQGTLTVAFFLYYYQRKKI